MACLQIHLLRINPLNILQIHPTPVHSTPFDFLQYGFRDTLQFVMYVLLQIADTAILIKRYSSLCRPDCFVFAPPLPTLPARKKPFDVTYYL